MTQPDPNENGNVQGQQTDPSANADPSGGTDGNVSQPDATTPDNGSSDQGNNLYAEYLEQFPTSLHPLATEVFKKWDGDVTKKIQSVHSEYEPYKPLVEAYEPDALQQAIAMAEAMERDPAAFMNALANAYGLTPPQQGQTDPVETQQVSSQNDLEYDLSDPVQAKLQQQEQLLMAIGQSLLEQRNNEQALTEFQQQEQAYNTLMTQLETKYGKFDVDYVNTLLANNVDPDKAVQQWKSQVEAYAKQTLAPNQTAPTVMGAGGGLPSTQKDPATMSPSETRKHVEEILRAAAANGG